LSTFQVDAFADGPGSGNPAGVCLLTTDLLVTMTDAVRQNVAAKVNLSETAFIEPVRQVRLYFSQLPWLNPAIDVACQVDDSN
jgi:predicted PhzF superfamily epimerase YddE/YHI9